MASGAVRTYNPERIVVTVNGNTITGFADGAFIAITQVADGITTQVGADGEIARAINTDQRANIVITLQQTSPSNDLLTRMYETDVLTCGGLAGPIEVADLCGTTIFAASTSWIVKLADIEFSNEITARAWTLQSSRPSRHNVGGNVAMGGG